ncbi:MAG TPA: hypothetical protein DCS93_39365 [Microscillaceae bacterium]|nr:hypothetical protein [Microscillaceae bacterium]
MGKYLLMIGLANFCCCTSKPSPIVGTWQVASKFYTATYKIAQTKQSFQAQVLLYDDGTTHYQYQGGTKQYLCKRLQAKNGQYLDGMASATQQKTNPGKTASQLTIKPKSKDTLEVISYIRQQPLVEHWVRKR